MKRKFNVLVMLFICFSYIYAEDLITTRSGEDIRAKIVEMDQIEIRYKLIDDLDGPLYFISKKDVLIVRHENGKNEIFNQQPAPIVDTLSVDYGTAGLVRPGMRYKEYKRFYSTEKYVRSTFDMYSPAAGGICSLIIPGLGQMICGEGGRGFAFLVPSIGFGIMTGVGASRVLTAAAEQIARNEEVNGSAISNGGMIMLVGIAGMLVVDLCAIVDGVRVAKIKNMYLQDMRRMETSLLDVKLRPYVSAISDGTMQTPVAGLSLAIEF